MSEVKRGRPKKQQDITDKQAVEIVTAVKGKEAPDRPSRAERTETEGV